MNRSALRIPSIGEILSTSLIISALWGGVCLIAFGGKELDDTDMAIIGIGAFIFTIVCLIGARWQQAKDERELEEKRQKEFDDMYKNDK